jgi:hypothetical protein
MKVKTMADSAIGHWNHQWSAIEDDAHVGNKILVQDAV